MREREKGVEYRRQGMMDRRKRKKEEGRKSSEVSQWEWEE